LLANLDTQQLLFFVILIAAFALLLTERLRNDLVAVLIILSLGVTGLLKPAEALSGFGSEPAIVVVSVLVMSAAFHQTRLDEIIGGWISRVAGSSLTGVLAVIMPTVALLSAFTHHLTTTAVMLPVTLNLSRQRSIAASKLLMPLSFAASLGTTITIIGAPAFLIASSALQQAGRPGLGIFSITPIGLALSIAGTLFILLIGRFLLPDRGSGDDPANRFRLDRYFTELTILPDSPFLDQTIAQVEANERYNFQVVGWMRHRRHLPRPYGDEQLRDGDVLLVRAPPEEIVAFRQESGVELHPVAKYGDSSNGGNDQTDEDVEAQLVQVVVSPNSDLVGRTIAAVDFRRRYGAIVVGLWRKRGWLQQEMSKIRLRAGDVLVLQGEEEALDRVASDHNFLMMMPFQGEARLRRKAPLVAVIMLATIVVASLNWLTLDMVTMSGAVAMVLLGCITPRQAYRAIDGRIYLFIAGAIPLGLAMQQTGAAKLLAEGLQAAIGGWPETLILFAIFAVVGIITQFMSDAGTTALFAPIAVALAQALGHPPEQYVVTVAMAAVASFLTPIGHHGNLLVYGPGRYQFADFVRVGTPLTIIVGIIVSVLAQLIW
jgi:di/tricarboxylate transporter